MHVDGFSNIFNFRLGFTNFSRVVPTSCVVYYAKTTKFGPPVRPKTTSSYTKYKYPILNMAAVIDSLGSIFSKEIFKYFKISWTVGIIINSTYILICSVKESFRSFERKEGRTVKNSRNSLPLVLFFPDKHIACRNFFSLQGCHKENCPFAHEETSLWRLLEILSKAETTLDVCVFTINCHELADAVVTLHKKGVVVRILTDNEQMGTKGSQIKKFRSEGIQVRHDLSSFFMHHKFVIMDRYMLLNGSFNWTRQAVTGNRENVVVTDDEEVVQSFVAEFEKLWNEYDPRRKETK
mgnify:CR=1 FL=1